MPAWARCIWYPVVQLGGTALLLVAVPSTGGKTLALLTWWRVTFGRLNRPEAIFFVAACCFFTLMDVLALRQGIFAFATSDVLGMPYYEPFMWGLCTMHIQRMLGGPAPEENSWTAWALVEPFALCFAAISDPQLLLLMTATIL